MAPLYHVEDAQEQTVFMIEGPTCVCQGGWCVGDQDFVVSLRPCQSVSLFSMTWRHFIDRSSSVDY